MKDNFSKYLIFEYLSAPKKKSQERQEAISRADNTSAEHAKAATFPTLPSTPTSRPSTMASIQRVRSGGKTTTTKSEGDQKQ